MAAQLQLLKKADGFLSIYIKLSLIVIENLFLVMKTTCGELKIDKSVNSFFKMLLRLSLRQNGRNKKRPYFICHQQH